MPEGWLHAHRSVDGPTLALGSGRPWRPAERLRAAEDALDLDMLATPDISGAFRRRIDPQATPLAVLNAGLALRSMSMGLMDSSQWRHKENVVDGAYGFLRLVRN